MVTREMVERAARNQRELGIGAAHCARSGADTPVPAGDDESGRRGCHCLADTALQPVRRRSVYLEAADFLECTLRRVRSAGGIVDERWDHQG